MVSTPTLTEIAKQTRACARQLVNVSTIEKNNAIATVAEVLKQHDSRILAANQADCEAAQVAGISSALYARLKLSESKLNGAIAGVQEVGHLPDPVGQVQMHRELDTEMVLRRVTCPLGVLGVIFEARPDAVMQIASLAIKSGNGVILKGGKEAIASCQAIVGAIREGLGRTAVDPNVVQLLTTRAETVELLTLDRYVDLIIPRGSNRFVRFVQENTRIPVLGHADGICHLYLDRAAPLATSIALTVDGKTQYPAACNAIETLLIHQDIASTYLPAIVEALQAQGVELKGDDASCQILPTLTAATVEDWVTEYSDLVLSVRVVESVEAAIEHINTYGSRHTDAIVTEDVQVAAQFMAQVDSANVYHNCSTRFSDGFRYGFGAEVGISTQKMPPRGPVGLDALVTYKYQLVGAGNVVATYAGENARSFIHRDL